MCLFFIVSYLLPRITAFLKKEKRKAERNLTSLLSLSLLRLPAPLLERPRRRAHVAVWLALHLDGTVVAARRRALALGDASPLEALRAGRVVGALQNHGPAERRIAATVPGAKCVARGSLTGSSDEGGQGGERRKDNRGELHGDGRMIVIEVSVRGTASFCCLAII